MSNVCVAVDSFAAHRAALEEFERAWLGLRNATRHALPPSVILLRRISLEWTTRITVFTWVVRNTAISVYFILEIRSKLHYSYLSIKLLT